MRANTIKGQKVILCSNNVNYIMLNLVYVFSFCSIKSGTEIYVLYRTLNTNIYINCFFYCESVRKADIKQDIRLHFKTNITDELENNKNLSRGKLHSK
jgi:hypothetical protein